MDVDVVNHRQPTLSYIQPLDVEPGCKVMGFWNGSQASNGDGLPGGDGDIDYASWLFDPRDVWPAAQPHLFGGKFGAGGFGEPGAAVNQSLGFATGPFGVGAFGVGGAYWEWRFPFLLRDGIYQLALRLLDALGNARDDDAADLTLCVEAAPRPCSRARFEDYDSQTETLTFTWRHSPDLESAD